jgi:2-haloacid dehalogenase
MTDLDFGRFEALTFDCYGTLIDWESGILAGIRPVLERYGVRPDDDELLEAYAVAEADLEAGPYRSYREILGEGLRRVAAHYDVEPTRADIEGFGASVGEWPAFGDSSAALAALQSRFRLGVITNCDDDLFSRSAERLGIAFDPVVTAQQAGSYKPSERNFHLAFERLDLPRERILHVAQSLFHDHVPAKELGLATAWIDRRRERPGAGATPRADASPDIAVPDMASFAELALG